MATPFLLLLTLVVIFGTSAGAQSLSPEERVELPQTFAVGLGGTFAATPDEAIGNSTSYRPVIRLRPRSGWGPSIEFSWTRHELQSSPDFQPGVAKLTVRPVMGGVQYGISRGRLSSSFSLVGGYAFNDLLMDAARPGPWLTISVSDAPSWRAGVSVWYGLMSRMSLNIFGGYRFTRPTLTFTGDTGTIKQRLNADAVLVSVGFAYWIF